MAKTSKEVLVELDERGRAALRAHGAQPGARYLATFLEDGSIVLTPAVVVTAADMAALKAQTPGPPDLDAQKKEP